VTVAVVPSAPPSPEQRFLDDPRRLQAVRRRSRLVTSIRSFLDERGFLEIQTPILHEVPEVAYVSQYTTRATNGRTLYLRTDPEEYLKRCIGAGLEAVYEVAANARGDAIDDLHLQEFTSVECYKRFWSFDEALAFCDELLTDALRAIGASIEAPQIITFTDAVAMHAGIDIDSCPTAGTLANAIRARWTNSDLPAGEVARLRRPWLEWLADTQVLPRLTRPTYIVEFPIELGLTAVAHPARRNVALRGELYLPGGVELAHLYENLTERDAMERRSRERILHRIAAGMPPIDLDHAMLAAAARGIPPMSGFAIGVDRLFWFASGCIGSVGDGLMFPREGAEGPA
jgi:lysyl-tRNA synthetase class 2